MFLWVYLGLDFAPTYPRYHKTFTHWLSVGFYLDFFLQERLNSIYLNITNSTRSTLWIYLRTLRLLKWISFTMLGANSFRQFQNCILVLWLYYNISPRKGKHFYDKTTKPNITLFVSSSSLPSWLCHLLCSWCSGEKKSSIIPHSFLYHPTPYTTYIWIISFSRLLSVNNTIYFFRKCVSYRRDTHIHTFNKKGKKSDCSVAITSAKG